MSETTNSNSTQMPLVTFNSLYSLLREEKKIKILQKLPERFYEALNKFFEDKKKEIQKLKEKGENEKLRKEKHVLSSSKKVTEELLHLRCMKISNIAIKTSLFENESFGESNILEEEQTFFDDVKKSTNKAKKIIN